ncbi:unnamed protein product [Periconia digitata]|uniref:Vacuolar membrane-associated protein IML1 n=1 Tax=Periconia digitata TaxID=1303443 RepID=A0A9W4UU23_9PLEO|nr:unnamed protein product [Periconia digitata]
MSDTVVTARRTRVQKVCTLWTHDDNFSKEDVVFNGDKFLELPATPGCLIQVIALKQGTAVRDFQASTKVPVRDSGQSKPDDSSQYTIKSPHTRRSRRGSLRVTLDENGSVIQDGREVDMEKSYTFVAKPFPADLKSKQSNLNLSVAERIARVFGLRNRMQVIVTLADEEKHSASHVEITFRDEYLARADMWRMSIAELSNRTVYRGQKLLFMGTIKAAIKNVYINGQSTHSGYFSPMTKPVFRSESARYVLFIQMSREMWDFDAEGAGEIMFNKVVNGFLPDLFKRWMKISAKHVVTIILFTRMQYTDGAVPNYPDGTTNTNDFESRSGRFRDYYRVVVSDMASGDWINILYQLKKEFRTFLRDVSLVPREARASPGSSSGPDNPSSGLLIAGKPSTAAQGNILEAINLAGAQFAKDYIDRDLVRTGISVIVVTAGTGVFEVDFNMLKLTTDTLVGSGIGIDLVCLSPMPLHSVPLFKYRNPRSVSLASKRDASEQQRQQSVSPDQLVDLDEKTPRQHEMNFGSKLQEPPVSPPPILANEPVNEPTHDSEWRYAMPHWVDISFWSGTSEEIIELSKLRKPNRVVKKVSKKGGTFALRCRMYELQMMGVMENELGDISLPYLEEDFFFPHQLRDQLSAHSHSVTEPWTRIAGRKARAMSVIMTANGSVPSKDGKESSDGPDDESRALYKQWMETYDEMAFRPVTDRRFRNDNHPTDLDTRRNSLKQMSREPILSSSYRTMNSSQGKTVQPSDVELHDLIHDRSRGLEAPPSVKSRVSAPDHKDLIVPRADILARKITMDKLSSMNRPYEHRRGGSGDVYDARSSSHTTPRDSPTPSRGSSPPRDLGPSSLVTPTTSGASTTEKRSRPAAWFLRQISFGGRANPVAEPTTGVATIDITPGRVKPARMTIENNQKGLIAEKLASTRSTAADGPSQPINIRKGLRIDSSSGESPSSSDRAGRSVETVRGMRVAKASLPSFPNSVAKDPGSTFLIAGSRATGDSINPKIELLSSSGGAKTIPQTLSPTSAIAPWAVLVNPCNPTKNTLNIANQFRRWQHVFPKRLKTASVKWKSLCSPAAVPLTHEYFPSAEQLAAEYNESPYKVIQNDDEEVLEAPKSRESLVRELIAFRLSHGFQILVGAAVAEYSGGKEQDISSIFHSEYMSRDGDTVFMNVGSTIHQLVCVAGGEVEVKRYSRKPTTALESSAGIDTPFSYKPYIRTALEEKYHARDIVLRPPRKEYNWNFIDTFLAGYHDEFSEILRFWRARFVLIPVDIPTISRRPLPMLAEDSEEEIRLEGIRKLTHVWQKYRYIPPEERHFHPATSSGQKDPNPLAIEYHTRDPSAVVSAGSDSSLLNENASDFQTSLFTESEQYHTSNIDIEKLAEDVQGEKGIPIFDRRWHWKLHTNCFLGFDLTSWLLSNFKNIATRDEAVDLGNQLMVKGLFQHVQGRHQFRDGNFFYQIAATYRASRPESRTGWFGIRRIDRSVPSTPLSEGPRASPLASRSVKSRPSTSDSSSIDSGKDGEKTPTRHIAPKRKVLLSGAMRYDVDPRKRSYRPEIISLHYDRLHNPDNCYHIRIEWMNVTAKLIEDAIVSWATSVEKYGLKLIEVPIAEASNIKENHPFRSPYIVRLAVQPPQDFSQTETLFEASNVTSNHTRSERFPYQKAILRKLNFVLDMEARDSFPTDVDVNYSWGNPDYKYTQFIHRTGVLLVQITSDGNFLLGANRLAHNRAKDTSRFKPVDLYDHKRSATDTDRTPVTPGERANLHRSPFSSPLARPVQDSSLLHTALDRLGPLYNPHTHSTVQTPEQIKDEMEAFCFNATQLQAFYKDALKPTIMPSPSPRIHPVIDNNIPSLGLPPAINIQGASPSTGGWTLSGSASAGGSNVTGRRIGSDTSDPRSSILGRRRRSVLPEEIILLKNIDS